MIPTRTDLASTLSASTNQLPASSCFHLVSLLRSLDATPVLINLTPLRLFPYPICPRSLTPDFHVHSPLVCPPRLPHSLSASHRGSCGYREQQLCLAWCGTAAWLRCSFPRAAGGQVCGCSAPTRLVAPLQEGRVLRT